MRLIKFDRDSEATLTEVAKSYGVEQEKLWELYLEIMRRNYFDDLCDIARENNEELKGE